MPVARPRDVGNTVKRALLSPFCCRSERRRYFRAYVSVVDKKSDTTVGVMIAAATREKAKDHNPALTCDDDSSIFIKTLTTRGDLCTLVMIK